MAKKEGILSRFGTIISANVNALLDKCEDPAKMTDQYLIEAKNDLADVKEAAAGVMADEKDAKRLLDQAQAEADKYDSAARAALKAGNEADARALLEARGKAEAHLAPARQTYDAAKANADKMRQLHDKLVADINDLEARKNMVKANAAVAKAQSTVNDFANKGARGMAGFDRMERKAQNALDRSSAEMELNEPRPGEAEDLASKYASGGTDTDEALAKMKAEMGL
ncbi:MAG: PspA/IM30 family protein [Clostridiales bacterium]|jgi:phage shock protein A|nr:PspA/IM30 family protein [Clostridiales bacterium]